MPNPQRKIVWAKSPQVVELRPYVQRVLDAIAVDQPHAAKALVTDRSVVGDFYLVGMDDHTSASVTEDECQQQIAMVNHRLGVDVSGTDLIVDVARRLCEEETR
jgi:hypothetical protein